MFGVGVEIRVADLHGDTGSQLAAPPQLEGQVLRHGEQDAADVPDGGLDPESGAVVDEGSDAVVLINGESAEQVGDYWVANVDGRLDVAVDLDEEAILAAGGSVSLGTVGKPHPGRGPDGLGAPGQLKKAERERALEERETSGTETSRDTDSEPPVDEATPLSKDATDRLSAIDVNA